MTGTNREEVTGYVRAAGKKLVNGEGRELLLRGVGLGSWLLPEGYMWRFPEQGDRPRRIERMIEELIGPAGAERFWSIYWDRYVAEADIRQIAAEGFNSIRVPINARFLLANGEAPEEMEGRLFYIDRVIEWCRAHRLYVILDLHGAPGGQTGANIDDSERDQPELFMSEENERLTVRLWRLLADRYKDEWIVAGYDLLNEPLPEWFSAYYGKVMPLYRKIVEAIREVDAKHMIILEGVHWSTDWSIFDEKPDRNVMLQFHKYWNNPDTESIQAYLNKREEWDVPIFMGEGGENNIDWYAGAFRLFEDHDISWNFWTWKKMDTSNSPCSVRKPEGWPSLVAYLEGGARPEAALAKRVLWEYLDNLALARCDYHPEVVNALFRRPPVRIPAAFYGYRGEGVSFHAAGRAAPPRGLGDGDGADIRLVESERTTANFQHGQGEAWRDDEWLCVRLTAEDWLAYEFALAPGPVALPVTVELRLSAPDGFGRLSVAMDGTAVAAAEVHGAAWQTVRLEEIFRAGPGPHRMVLKAERGPVQIQWIEIR